MLNNRWLQTHRDLVGLLIFVVLLAGCARTPSISYYQLASRYDAAGESGSAAAEPFRTIGLGPVRLPEYLARIQLVRRLSANQLEISSYQRWAEPLTESVPRILGENLAALLDRSHVVRYPWSGSRAVDNRIIVDILQFEGGPDGTVILDARWQMLDEAGAVLAAEQKSRFQLAASAEAEVQAAALSDALWLLARDIASVLAAGDDTP